MKRVSKFFRGEQTRGFTLVEFLIYIAIIGVTLGAFIQFMLASVTSRAQARAVGEVNANVRTLSDIMTQKIHHAVNVLSPTEGSSGASINLDMPTPQPDITFSLIGGRLYLTEQGGSSIPITSKDVVVGALLATNYAILGEPDNIRFSLLVRYNNRGTGVEYQYSRVLLTTASIRQ